MYRFMCGSYGKNGQEGITRYRLDTANKVMIKEYAYTDIVNPSFVTVSHFGDIIYAVSENSSNGSLYTLRDKDGRWDRINCFTTEGTDPCHISVDSNNRMLFVANYTSGSLAVFKLGDDEVPVKMTDIVRHEGRGYDPQRQDCAHIHFTREHAGELYAVDLGLDRVYIYTIDRDNGKLIDTGRCLRLPAGYGPRHLEFNRDDQDIIYVICELKSRIAVFRKDGDTYNMIQDISTVSGECADNAAAAVKIRNGMLFASNRGDDSIAAFRIENDGTLRQTDIKKTGGRIPRDLEIIGDHAVIANQGSDLITVMGIDYGSGKLGEIEMEAEHVSPTCVVEC